MHAERRHPFLKGSVPVRAVVSSLIFPLSHLLLISRGTGGSGRVPVGGRRARDSPLFFGDPISSKPPLNILYIPRNDPQRVTFVHDTLRIPGSISSTDLRRDLWSAATPWKSPARYYPLCGVSAASSPPCRAEVDSPTQQMTAGAQQERVPGQR